MIIRAVLLTLTGIVPNGSIGEPAASEEEYAIVDENARRVGDYIVDVATDNPPIAP